MPTIKPRTKQKVSIDFDLRQLEIFRNVVELGSFSKAADAVFLAQASVSERIANLENMVGTKLLDRLGRKVTPTRAGEFLYKHAILLLEMKRTACLELQEFLGLKHGQISIGGSTIPGNYILPKLMGEFRKTYPSISVSLLIADTVKIEQQVMAGELELGVIGSRSPQKAIRNYNLWQDELVLAVPPSHRWAERSEIDPEELMGEPFILRETGSGTLKILEEYLKGSKIKGTDGLNAAARLGTSTAVKEGIKAGLGVSILSSRAIETEVETGVIRTLRIKNLNLSRSFYLIHDKRRTASPLCRAMIDFLLTTKRARAPI
jgi:DNA-binding transcriptional LysR family regulator